MPLSGTGMLITLMDVLPHEEADFNDWYDKEHLAERVQIEGFLEARRYVAVDESESPKAKYLNLYTTRDFAVLDSEEYKRVLQSQTPRSVHHIPKFLNGTRALARVSTSIGQGRGGYVASLHLRPSSVEQQESLREVLVPIMRDAVAAELISAHILEGDPELSRPLMTDAEVASVTDWFVILDATQLEVAQQGLQNLLAQAGLQDEIIVSQGLYRLLWDLSKNEL
ncbi:hypothetical protein EKL30_03635 [Candidimonas sp. SYP-B2681]|uniref:DUF4286 family protein n=1 Tax=Candidimonas sp. SYP-B2681 TaxID=2497686 RepID=UPI000F85F456|nr:DUF4286 family protein [Candidimonas sp. SYP-B2681]RTZ48063.1 hypothetical protein EKL30_03635 [Candidimonas sp. SYP-B2681]